MHRSGGDMTMADWALLTLTGVSAMTDLLLGKIYNVVVLPAAIVGLVLAGLPGYGGSGPVLAGRFANMLLVAAILLPVWVGLPGSIGGGDIKLYLAAAALLPQMGLLTLLFLSLAAAGGIAVLREIRLRQVGGDREHRIRIGPAVFCAALMYTGGLYG